MELKEYEKLVLPSGARLKALPAEEVERVRVAPDGIHVEFHDGTVRIFRAKNLKFELPGGHIVDVDTLLKRYSIEGYVAT